MQLIEWEHVFNKILIFQKIFNYYITKMIIRLSLSLLSILFTLSFANATQINGKIHQVTEKSIQIGDETLIVNDDGIFVYEKDLKNPELLDVAYAAMEWTVYLEPETNLGISIADNNLNNITYEGKLKSENIYLLEINNINIDVNNYLESNWESLHRMPESGFVREIDSLKQLYLAYMVPAELDGNKLTVDFIDHFGAHLDLSFNRLIVMYPERQYYFTGEAVTLSPYVMEEIEKLNLDNEALLDVQGYKKFVAALINFKTEQILNNDTSELHYSMRKTEAVFKLISEMFEQEQLRDFWLSEYMIEHIQANGIANSEQLVDYFYSVCKTADFKRKVKDKLKSDVDARKDHEVYVYKTANGFNIEAHLFKPKQLKSTVKKPAIAIFHGGGWIQGNASWAYDRAKHFADLGLVGVAVQYRLANRKDVSPIESMEDARDLFIWLRKNADKFGIDPNKIAGEGWSAGGHLVASAAILSDTVDGISSVPDVMILKSPALDTNPKNDSYFQTLLLSKGYNPLDYSPLDKIEKNKQLPPMLILQGETDRLTPTIYAKQFDEKMNALGFESELVIYENCGHLFTPSHLDDTGWPQPDKAISAKANLRAEEFLKQHGYIVAVE